MLKSEVPIETMSQTAGSREFEYKAHEQKAGCPSLVNLAGLSVPLTLPNADLQCLQRKTPDILTKVSLQQVQHLKKVSMVLVDSEHFMDKSNQECISI